MGTRNSVIVIVDNEPKIAKSCQLNGFPSGVGLEVLDVLKKYTNLELMKEKVRLVKSLTKEEIDNRLKQVDSDSKGMSIKTVVDDFKKKNAHLSINMGGSLVLDLVMKGEVDETYLEPEFVGDGLFCEWAYVVDLDKNTFEVFRGFNKTPLTPQDRFFNTPRLNKEYYPVKLLVEYSLTNLPSEDKFLGDTNESYDICLTFGL
jgi:hypothetical protein